MGLSACGGGGGTDTTSEINTDTNIGGIDEVNQGSSSPENEAPKINNLGVYINDNTELLTFNESTLPVNDEYDGLIWSRDKYDTSVLRNCAKAHLLNGSCYLSNLPSIGDERSTASVSVSDIMAHVVTSEEWMLDNFEAYLNSLDEEVLQAFSPVTVIIATDKSSGTIKYVNGMLELDSRHLWLDFANKIEPLSEDDTSDNLFQYSVSYVKDSTNLESPSTDADRTLEEVSPFFSSTLFWGLGALNNAYRVSYGNVINPSYLSHRYFIDSSSAGKFGRLDLNFELRYPLSSEALKNVAQFTYTGADVDVSSYTAEELVNTMKADNADDLSSYISTQNRVGNLFMAVLLDRYLDVQLRIYFADNPYVDSSSFFWGQDNRIADPTIKEMAKDTVELFMPLVDFDDYFEDMAPPVELTISLP